jgi:hypothetical protein
MVMAGLQSGPKENRINRARRLTIQYRKLFCRQTLFHYSRLEFGLTELLRKSWDSDNDFSSPHFMPLQRHSQTRRFYDPLPRFQYLQAPPWSRILIQEHSLRVVCARARRSRRMLLSDQRRELRQYAMRVGPVHTRLRSDALMAHMPYL